MFDLSDLKDIVSLHNLFEPLTSFFDDILRGPGVHFGIATYGDHRKREIRQLLERNGINTWGDMYDGQYTYFTIREDQAKQAYQIMKQAGVAVLWPKLED